MAIHADGQERSRVPSTDTGVAAPPQEQGGVFILSWTFTALLGAVYLLYSRNITELIDRPRTVEAIATGCAARHRPAASTVYVQRTT